MTRKTHKRILLSASLLGASSLLSLPSVVNAAPRNGGNDVRQERRDVKQARKEVKQERKEARKADTPFERRDARQDVREAQRDLRNERQDVRQERREDNRYDNRNGNRSYNPNWNRTYPPTNPNWTRPNPGHNNGYNPGYNNGAWSQQNFTIEGTVISNVSYGRSNSFTLRATNGQVWNVQAQGTQPVGLSRGDIVRVFGPTRNNMVMASGLRILQNR